MLITVDGGSLEDFCCFFFNLSLSALDWHEKLPKMLQPILAKPSLPVLTDSTDSDSVNSVTIRYH